MKDKLKCFLIVLVIVLLALAVCLSNIIHIHDDGDEHCGLCAFISIANLMERIIVINSLICILILLSESFTIFDKKLFNSVENILLKKVQMNE